MQRKVGVAIDPLVGAVYRHDRLAAGRAESPAVLEGAWHAYPTWSHQPNSEVARALSRQGERRPRRGNGTYSPAFVHRRSAFYFLRHGETPENRDGILQGQRDTELTAAGRQMAWSAARILAELGLGSIYASPLRRTWLTASIVAELIGLRVQPVAGLMERHWGAFEGKPKAMRPRVANPETAEPIDDFYNRVVRAMDSMTGAPPILVVAHSGVFRVLCATLGIGGRKVRLAPGQVTTFVPPAAAERTWRLCPPPTGAPARPLPGAAASLQSGQPGKTSAGT